MQLQFLGGAGTVTGSKYLVSAAGRKLLVDCGLFQGLKQLRLHNWTPLAERPQDIDAVLLTHAHIDHSGFLPRLVDQGFRGTVFCTPGTAALCGLLLPDAGHLQEEEARFANRRGFSRHAPALPLYTEDSARRALSRLRPVGFGERFEPLPGFSAVFSPAGHILGAASLHLQAEGRSVLFSGDLGREDDLLMKPPAPPPAADVVLIESTYGNRRHEAADPLDRLAEVVCRTAARGGVVLVPAFAVGRAQALLLALHRLKQARRIPDLPVFLNSPMAADVTGLLVQHAGEHRLNAAECRAMCRGVTVVNSEDQSRALNQQRFPCVIVSASGMATGGRVLHHLALYLGHHRNMVVLTGYQAPGTRGDSLARGNKAIRIHGQDVPVRAEVVQLQSASAHADASQLMDWLRSSPQAPHRVFVTHGEMGASDALRQRIERELGWRALAPEHGSTWAV